jgi:hypothetical protein
VEGVYRRPSPVAAPCLRRRQAPITRREYDGTTGPYPLPPTARLHGPYRLCMGSPAPYRYQSPAVCRAARRLPRLAGRSRKKGGRMGYAPLIPSAGSVPKFVARPNARKPKARFRQNPVEMHRRSRQFSENRPNERILRARCASRPSQTTGEGGEARLPISAPRRRREPKPHVKPRLSKLRGQGPGLGDDTPWR